MKQLAFLLSLLTLLAIASSIMNTNDDRSDRFDASDQQMGTYQNRTHSVRATDRRLRCRCQNGGLCIHRGLFCDCPVHYSGRFCEHRSGNHSCGSLRHADTFLDFSGDCRYCQCFNGTLNCDDTYTCKDLRDLQFLVDTTWNAANYPNIIRDDLFSFVALCVLILHKAIFAA